MSAAGDSTLHGAQLILGLLIAVAALVTIARRLGIAYPIFLVIGGLILGLVPGVPRIQVDPEENAAPAYACRDRYPGVKTQDLFLSGNDGLVAGAKSVTSGSGSFLAPPEVTLSTTEISALDQNIPIFDAPGTSTSSPA